ncbi:MAG: DNA polymerase I, partial [Neisseriaceae bacterium]|nr:DNA polymerase I [Neisseriaceae bacterium]
KNQPNPVANLAPSKNHDLFSENETPTQTIHLPEIKPETVERRYETVLTDCDLQRWLTHLQHAEQQGILVAIDTETTGLDAMNDQLVGISFSMEAGVACYIPLAHCGPNQPQQLNRNSTLMLLKPWLESPLAKKVGHNLKFDRHIFANHGIALAGIVHDTLLAAYVLKSHEKHSLSYLAEIQLGLSTIDYESLCGKGAKMIGFEQVDVARAAYYAAEDADLTLRLCAILLAKMDDRQRRVYESIELPTAQVLFTIERNGVCIDAAALAAQSHDLAVRLLGLESEIYALAGQPFNINSPKQMQTILFETLAFPTKGLKKTPTGGYSTDESVLEILATQHPLPQKILDYRGLSKLKSTYTDKLGALINPKTGRLHTTYAQSVVITGRLASNNPNLQNIPVRTIEGRKVREAFVTESDNCLVSADYSQIELRIMAHLSGDATMIQAFERGDDIHQATAAEVFGVPLAEVTADQRRSAKAINFGLIYGMGAYGLARALNISNGAAKDYIERYFARYPNIAHYMEATRERAKQMGYVETAFGRRLYQLD